MPVDWGQIAQVGMNMASQYANNRQQARAAAANAQQTQNSQGIAQNNAQNNVLLQMAQIELLRKQMEEANRQGRAQQTVRGDLMANVQDARFSRPAGVPDMSLSGGLRPSALGPNSREAGRELSSQALSALKSGDTFMPINPMGPIDLDANMPQESTFDKILGGVGAVGGAMASYDQTQRQAQQETALTRLLEQMQREQEQRRFSDAVKQYGGMGL
jgi:hypothetical protein